MRFQTRPLIFVMVASALCYCSAQEFEWSHEAAALSLHNNYRYKHGSKTMTISTELSELAAICAQDYVQRQVIDHNCQAKSKDVGENLYISFGSQDDKTDSIIAAVESWYDEIKDYNYDMPGESQGVIGHFTQLVWDASTQLGCSAATVDTVTAVCCLYKLQGNIISGNGDLFQFYKTNVKRLTM